MVLNFLKLPCTHIHTHLSPWPPHIHTLPNYIKDYAVANKLVFAIQRGS